MADYKSYGFMGRIVKPFEAVEVSDVLHDVLNRKVVSN
jgi:hypothetical protein